MSEEASIDQDIDALCAEALKLFFGQNEVERSSQHLLVGPTSGGLNNRSFYVRAPTCVGQLDEQPSFVLRICNNGRNVRAVDYEVRILEHLSSMCSEQNLSFRVPTPKHSQRDHRFETLSNGGAATLTALIPGHLPTISPASSSCDTTLQLIEDFGSAAGQLSRLLAAVDTDRHLEGMASPNPALFNPWLAHHAITRDLFFSTINSEQFAEFREPIDFLLEQLDEVERRIGEYRSAGTLPLQLIHGDLHHDNILVDGARVTGILDFEFCALDWRATEFAICISKWIDLPDPLPLIDRFSRGFCRHVAFTADEIDAVAFLVILRLLTNIIFFVGRIIAKEEAVSTLTRRFDQYRKRIIWTKGSCDALVGILKSYSITTTTTNNNDA